MRHRSFAVRAYQPSPGTNKKPDLYAAAAVCTKVRAYLASSRYLNACKAPFRSFEEICFASGFRSGAKLSPSRYDYFFLDVFFATFLVAFAVFFAFFAFLAMSSSFKNWLSEHAHAEYRHAQH
jgi:hypothetical protein